MVCATCGTENEAGRKFCKACGSSLALLCPSCGTANTPDSRFCGECGSALTATGPPAAPAAPPAAATERRLVSVLFADLVGSTATPLDLACCAIDMATVLPDEEVTREAVAEARSFLEGIGAVSLLERLDAVERASSPAGTGSSA